MARIRNVAKFDAERARLLTAAATCFVREGFHGASIAAICAEAGDISPGRLYHYFPSKQAIVEALVAEERKAFATLVAVFHADADPLRGLLALVRQAVTLAAEVDYAALAAEVVAESARNPEIARIVRYAERDYREQFIAILARVREAGAAGDGPSWPAKADDRLARAITLLLDGAAVRAMLEPTCKSVLPGEMVGLVRLLLNDAGAYPKKQVRPA